MEVEQITATNTEERPKSDRLRGSAPVSGYDYWLNDDDDKITPASSPPSPHVSRAEKAAGPAGPEVPPTRDPRRETPVAAPLSPLPARGRRQRRGKGAFPLALFGESDVRERTRILGKAGEKARGQERTDLGMEGGLPVDAADAAKGRMKDGSKDVCLPARTSAGLTEVEAGPIFRVGSRLLLSPSSSERAFCSAMHTLGDELLSLPVTLPAPALQGSAKRWAPGLVNFITSVSYHFCPSLPAAFTRPGDHLLADLCISDELLWKLFHTR